MKALVVSSYGSPDDLDLTDLARPEPADGEVLVRVRATSVNPYDWHHLRGTPYVARLMPGSLGLRGPKISVLGGDVAGRVEAVGRGVTDFRPGDDVFGLLRQGGFAEYVSAPAGLLAPKPARLSYEQAAAVPMAAVTALLALRDEGRVQAGQRVLVNGASGGVGTFAVQLAAALGAKVTGVCSSRNAAVARSIGADEVIAYDEEDFTRSAQRYDLVLDIAGRRPMLAGRRILTPKGTWVAVGGPSGRWVQPAGHMFAALAVAPLVPQRITLADATRCRGVRSCLETLTGFIEDGQVTPVIDRVYPFEQIRAAITYQEAGHAQGKVVITI